MFSLNSEHFDILLGFIFQKIMKKSTFLDFSDNTCRQNAPPISKYHFYQHLKSFRQNKRGFHGHCAIFSFIINTTVLLGASITWPNLNTVASFIPEIYKASKEHHGPVGPFHL